MALDIAHGEEELSEEGEDDEKEQEGEYFPDAVDKKSLASSPSVAPEIYVETKAIDESDGVITQDHLKYIAHELGLIKLCWDDVRPVDYDSCSHYPWNYMNNTEKEKILLWYSENFRRQYTYRFSKKRPLLMACDNEFGLQKMVCTTIRPTTIKYPEFQTWQGCAKFVADYLKYEYLGNATVLPDRINSPREVLRRQSGHCFEYSTLLVSYLVGSAYDAYVVCGYATREICLNDRTRTECPLEPEEEEEEEVVEEKENGKYALREPNDLRSKFLLEMEAREIRRQKDAARAQELAELAAIKEYEKPWPDELWGWRLHSWVLLLPSKDVSRPFFIESVTGVAKSVEDPDYHGIESVWNHQNYWVLVQFPGKTSTCEDISFDLSDGSCWEHLLIGEPFTSRCLPQELADAEPEEVGQHWVQAEKHLDMPPSWVGPLDLKHSDYERKYPNSRKITHYRKCIAEEYAPYVHSDGLYRRVTRFNDYDYEEPRDIKERFENRVDRMHFSHNLVEENSVLQQFRRGRDDALKEHFFYQMDAGIEVSFQLKFYHEARLDGLSALVMDPSFMVENFEGRSDFLYYRRVDFAPRSNEEAPFRDIVKIEERYHPNPEKDANLDVAAVEYFLPERKIQLKFQYEYQHVTQTYREFLKPPPAEMGERLTFNPALTSGYLSGPTVPEPKPLYLYQLQAKYFQMEEASVNQVRDRENELKLMMRYRSKELAAPQLSVSEFDVERNVQAREGFKQKELEAENARQRSLELVCDFLAPYFAKTGEPEDKPLSFREAQKMVDDCLHDWKDLLVARANEMQQQFEQASQDLLEKNNWYERNQGSLTREQEEEYFENCRKLIFKLHCLESRLDRHRELAPKKYLAMEAYLKSDKRLAVLFGRAGRKKRGD